MLDICLKDCWPQIDILAPNLGRGPRSIHLIDVLVNTDSNVTHTDASVVAVFTYVRDHTFEPYDFALGTFGPNLNPHNLKVKTIKSL